MRTKKYIKYVAAIKWAKELDLLAISAEQIATMTEAQLTLVVEIAKGAYKMGCQHTRGAIKSAQDFKESL